MNYEDAQEEKNAVAEDDSPIIDTNAINVDNSVLS